ncbi:hypothetical protein THASP1DRAFT_17226, partial [Thamnocephalis sphaerospora]
TRLPASFGQIAELSAILVQLKGESDAVAAKALEVRMKPLLKGKDIEEVHSVLVEEAATLLVAADKDLEGTFNLVLTVLRTASEEKIDAFTTCILETIEKSEIERTAAKLKILSNLFNALAPTSALRARVFQSLVLVAEQTGAISAIVPQLPHLDAWMAEWSLETEKRCELYLQISKALGAGGFTEQAFALRRKYLSMLPESAYGAAKESIVAIIADAIQTPSFYAFEELASFPSVKYLSKEPAGQLLTILVDSSVSEYRDFIGANDSAIKALGLAEEEVLRKMRTLALASIGAERLGVAIPYADIAKALEVETDEVEIWVIDAIRAGLVEARLDQLKETATISRSTYRVFGQREWQLLGSRLHAWRDSLSSVLSTVANARAGNTASNPTA